LHSKSKLKNLVYDSRKPSKGCFPDLWENTLFMGREENEGKSDSAERLVYRVGEFARKKVSVSSDTI